MSQADTLSPVSEPLQDHPERCSNPFCDAPMAAKNKHAPVKLFCCDRCRMDGYVLRRTGNARRGGNSGAKRDSAEDTFLNLVSMVNRVLTGAGTVLLAC
jgi:hypothetical protein